MPMVPIEASGPAVLFGAVVYSFESINNVLPVENQVRKTPSWPRRWANVGLFWMYSDKNAWANLHLLGQPNTFLAQALAECCGELQDLVLYSVPPEWRDILPERCRFDNDV